MIYLSMQYIFKETLVSGISSSSAGQNDRHFADQIFRCIFVNEKFWILTKYSLKFVPKDAIDNNSALV